MSENSIAIIIIIIITITMTITTTSRSQVYVLQKEGLGMARIIASPFQRRWQYGICGPEALSY